MFQIPFAYEVRGQDRLRFSPFVPYLHIYPTLFLSTERYRFDTISHTCRTHRMYVSLCTTSQVSNSCSLQRYDALSPTATYATRYQLWTRSRVKITLACTTTPYEIRQVGLDLSDKTHHSQLRNQSRRQSPQLRRYFDAEKVIIME